MSIVDEMEELRRANPVSVDEASELVALRRGEVADALQDTSWQRGPTLRTRSASDVSRRGMRAMLGAAAAIIVLVFVGFAVADRLDNRDVIEASVSSPSPDTDDPVLLASVGRGFDRSTDLLVVHFDFADRSDAHAAAAAREIASWFDVEPVVVVGTQAIDTDRSVHDYREVMDAVWGNGWLDASLDRPDAISRAMNRWITTLDTNGQIWVAEGGVADFTAELVGQIARSRPDLDTKASIHVLQHRARDEAQTVPSDLVFLQTNTDYTRIDSGDADNRSANLAGAASGFEASVLSGSHSEEWSSAFDYLAARELDFSDAVLLLDIVRVGTEHVVNPAEFVAYFIGDQPDAQFRGDS